MLASAMPEPRVLSIAGLDPTAGAGLTADVRVIGAHGFQPAGIATCLTVQNHRGLTALQPVDGDLIERSLAAILEQGAPAAVKIGLLGAVETAERVAALLPRLAGVPVVLDPVLSVSAGGMAAGEDLLGVYRERLLPRVTVATPNELELRRLAPDGVEALLTALGPAARLLITGGHGRGEQLVDRLRGTELSRDFSTPRQSKGAVHGTGCALSTALACGLAGGADLPSAVAAAQSYLQAALAATGSANDGAPVPLAIIPASPTAAPRGVRAPRAASPSESG